MIANHPEKTIDLREYGIEGSITVSAPTFRRRTALQNTVIPYTMTKEEKDKLDTIRDPALRKEYLDTLRMDTPAQFATIQAITVLAYVVNAPFHLSDCKSEMLLDVDSFFDFLDGANGDKIYSALIRAVDDLGVVDPLS